MGGFLVRAIASAFGLWLAAQLVPGVGFRDPASLVVAVVVLGLVNAVVRPVLVILTFPVTVLTLGLFLLVLNALLILLVSRLLPGFHVATFGAAVMTAIITGVISWMASGLTSGAEQRRRQ